MCSGVRARRDDGPAQRLPAVFLPLKDSVPLRRTRAPYVTRAIFALNVLVFVLFQTPLVFNLEPGFSMGLGLVPAVFTLHAYLDGLPHVPTLLTPVTSLFLHGSWLHLIPNMLFLWIFADNVEDAMGHLRFVVFYLLCGAISGVVYAFSAPNSEAPLIGASGAVSAIIGAYLMLHPRVHVFGLMFNVLPLTLRAQWALGAWILLQVANAFVGSDASVAWTAHIGGLAAGALLILPFKAPEVPLFGRDDGPEL